MMPMHANIANCATMPIIVVTMCIMFIGVSPTRVKIHPLVKIARRTDMMSADFMPSFAITLL